MEIKEARIKAGLTQKDMSQQFGIPKRTIENWESGSRNCPPYVEKLILEKLEGIAKMKEKEKTSKHYIIDAEKADILFNFESQENKFDESGNPVVDNYRIADHYDEVEVTIHHDELNGLGKAKFVIWGIKNQSAELIDEGYDLCVDEKTLVEYASEITGDGYTIYS